MNNGWTYRERVDRASVDQSVLEYYVQKYRHSSVVEWRSRIELGQVLLDGKQTTPETILRSGQWLTYHRPPWQEPTVPLSFEILYQDADLAIVSKPSGLPVMPGGGFLEHTLLWQLKQAYPQDTPIPIHRLGRGTSGLLLLARSPLAKSNLSQQMRDRQICKIYRALASGVITSDHLIIERAIGKIPHPTLGYIYAATADGLYAYSEAQVIERYANSTLLEVKILTGRPHQIRIHLAAEGFPLVGDPLYDIGAIPIIKGNREQGIGNRENSPLNLLPIASCLLPLPKGDNHQSDRLPAPGDCGYYLHAYHLAFTHPRTGEAMNFTCPEPVQEVISGSGKELEIRNLERQGEQGR
jgi:23S rRNA pseudouridine1911/1915/1917 synthase